MTFAGRLCAAAYVHNSQAYTVCVCQPVELVAASLRKCWMTDGQDCTEAANPNGISGREWCYVEVWRSLRSRTHPRHQSAARACQEQVANAGPQKWDYCAPKIDYADVRKRVGYAFAEKANEIADAIATVQGLSKEATRWKRFPTLLSTRTAALNAGCSGKSTHNVAEQAWPSCLSWAAPACDCILFRDLCVLT